MQTGTQDQAAADGPIIVRDVEFPIENLENGRGFRLRTSMIKVNEERFAYSDGLPNKLAKLVKHQPSFGLNAAKALKTNGDLIIEFDKPVAQMSQDCLIAHVFEPLARKIRRSHLAASGSKGSSGAGSSHSGYLKQPQAAQATA